MPNGASLWFSCLWVSSGLSDLFLNFIISKKYITRPPLPLVLQHSSSLTFLCLTVLVSSIFCPRWVNLGLGFLWFCLYHFRVQSGNLLHHLCSLSPESKTTLWFSVCRCLSCKNRVTVSQLSALQLKWEVSSSDFKLHFTLRNFCIWKEFSVLGLILYVVAHCCQLLLLNSPRMCNINELWCKGIF